VSPKVLLLIALLLPILLVLAGRWVRVADRISRDGKNEESNCTP
jgi:hypothetical protein